MKENNKKVVNMYLGNVEEYPDDVTKVSFEAIILDDSVSGNNVRVTQDALASKELLKSVKNKPIVANIEKYGFGDHEGELIKGQDGSDIFVRNTVPIGVFTEDGYITTREVNGKEVMALVGKGVLWKSRFNEAVTLLQNMWSEGNYIPMSSEYLFMNPIFEDGVEVHNKDSKITIEGLCILNESVIPAYESSTFTMLNQKTVSDFNRLVAQALNQEKEVIEMEEEKVETTEIEVEEEKTEIEVEEEKIEVEVEEEKERKINAISYYEIGREVLNQIKEKLDSEYAWTNDVYTEYVVVASEDDNYDIKYYKVNYSVNGNTVIADLDSIVEVKESRDWVEVTSTLNEEINNLNSKIETMVGEKTELVTKVETMTEQIVSLNSKLQELEPIREQMLNAEKESKLKDALVKYSKALNAETLENEEVLTLINQSIEDGEVGIDAKLKLSDIILNQVSTKKEEPELQTQTNSTKDLLASLMAEKRANLVEDTEDVLKDMRV